MVNMILALLAALNGGWMLFDGIHVLRFCKYFGSDIPGPWRLLPQALGIDPFSFGPVFVVLGFGWLASAIGIVVSPILFFWPLLVIALLTLWYIKVGTTLSLIALAILVFKTVQ